METPDTNEQTTLDYFRPVWARRWLILVIVAVATVATYAYYNGKPRVYAASATLYIGSGSNLQAALGGSVSSNPDRTLADLSRLIDSPPVFQAAARLIGNPAELGGISAAPSSGSDFIVLSSDGLSPMAAAATVNAYARAFIQFQTASARGEAAVALAQVQKQLSGISDPSQAAQLQQQVAQLKSQVAQPSSSIQQVAPAIPNTTPLSPQPMKNALFAFVLSLLFGSALAYGLDRLDQRLRSEEQLPTLYDVPVLAEISHVVTPTPTKDGVPVVDADQWESFRTLRTNLELASSRPLRTILVASAQPSEGKSLVVRNLALAYADAGARVAVVDGDLRRSSVARIFNIDAEPGLTDVLAQVELLSKVMQRVGAETESVYVDFDFESISDSAAVATEQSVATRRTAGALDVLTAGADIESRTAALAAPGIKAVLSRLTEEYDVVIVDSAPLLAVSDSVPLIGEVDGVIMVARIGTTTEHAARGVTELIGRVPQARVLGVIANGASKRAFHYGSEYGV